MIENLLTTGQLALKLGVSHPTIYLWARRGILPSIRIRRTLRFKPEDVEKFIRDHTRK